MRPEPIVLDFREEGKMNDDEVLRPTIVKSLAVRELSVGPFDCWSVDKDSFKTFFDRSGSRRFKFTHKGITISAPLSAIIGERTLLSITRGDFEKSADNKLPERNGPVCPQGQNKLFEEFYVGVQRVSKRRAPGR